MSEQIVMPTVDQFKTMNSIPKVGVASESGVDAQSCLDVPPKIRDLHAKALAAVAKWKTAEIELLQVLDEVECHKGYLRYGYNSLFQYAVKALGLSDGVAYNLINVGRAAREIPELKTAIASGVLSVSKARKITSVITRENSSTWIELAKSASQHQVEREVSLANPRESGRGRMNYVALRSEISERVVVKTTARVQLEVGISEKLMIEIRRAQGLVGQKLRRGATLEETLEAMVSIYLSKHDPSERAKRQLMRGKLTTQSETSDVIEIGETPQDRKVWKANEVAETNKAAKPANAAAPRKTSSSAQGTSNLQFPRIAVAMSASNSATHANAKSPTPAALARTRRVKRFSRRALPAATKHRVYLKFESRCSHVDRRGERCQETKFLEIHHLQPLQAGGDDRLENLTLLCSGHHKGIHLG